jgi:hypothetical protein
MLMHRTVFGFVASLPNINAKSANHMLLIGVHYLQLFGGEGKNSSGGVGSLNDLSMFNLTSRQWVWISGSNSIEPPTSWPSTSSPITGAIPPPRHMQMAWSDRRSGATRFFVFGGWNAVTTWTLADMWQFDTTTRQWTWLGGTRSVSVKITAMNKPDVGNHPGVRATSAVTADANGGAWLFGGYGLSLYSCILAYNRIFQPSINDFSIF